MKFKFAYLYLAFIVSLVILLILTFLFHNRLKSHESYTGAYSNTYTVIFSLRSLEEHITRFENSTRGYLLLKDSSFIEECRNSSDSVNQQLDILKTLIDDDSDQMRRFLLMRSTVLHQVSIYNRLLAASQLGENERTSLLRAKSLMSAFYEEARQIEKAEISIMDDELKRKERSETFYPGYFNTISVWAAIITLVSFFFIHRETTMRTKYQEELEKRLHELNRSNSELGQFAYIASHDLQEPLRKIRTFTNKLVYKYKDQISEEMKLVIGRIESSAQRMQELLQDMLNFTALINREEEMTPVDMNDVISTVLTEFIELSRERHAIITWDKMPEIMGNEAQLSLLFKSLLDNAFKFAKPGESPVIRISYKFADGYHDEDEAIKGKQYHKIMMEDKGIGFNNEFAEKIFMIFQRLHTQQSGYRGKGIGLAIAQRIMSNHNGIIMARGMINDGATFIMYFPAGNS